MRNKTVIKRIALENFKSLGEVDLPLGRVTVLIGPNGSGKSSVLQALTVLKQSIGQSGLNLGGPLVRLGGYQDVAREGSPTRPVKIAVSGVTRPSDYYPSYPLLEDVEAKPYSYQITIDGHGLQQSKVVYGGRELGSFSRAEPSKVFGFPVPHSKAGIALQASGTIGYPVAVGPVTSTSDLESEELKRVNEFARWLQDFIRLELSRVYYVPPLRGLDQPEYELLESPASEFPIVEGLTAQGSKLASTFAYQRDLEDKISGWLDQVVGSRVRFKLLVGRKVTLENPTTPYAIRMINEGFGSNQLLHLLTQLAVCPRNSLVLIDDPEVHLHPMAQAKLAELLNRVSSDEGKDMLIATHSEHFLVTLLTLVGEGSIRSEDLKVYYFVKDGGVSRAENLTVNPDGTIEGGLKGFFETHIETLGRYLKAQRRSESA
jgi:energy-coupling factor transporter ATP-binding protein EcfA2